MQTWLHLTGFHLFYLLPAAFDAFSHLIYAFPLQRGKRVIRLGSDIIIRVQSFSCSSSRDLERDFDLRLPSMRRALRSRTAWFTLSFTYDV